ncbi:hypothetical protein ACEWY4_022645 [Coilia grayii]|uniref:Ig-like domain-containing protein n=1 Tax=Coilia grayii TaxID=363190 RepID=A0ABD1J0R4_9TELE
MEIRWFKDTDCIYLYANGHVTVGGGYEDRVSVTPQQLQRGDVSLTLRGVGEEDRRVYTCQVISGEHTQEGRVALSKCVCVFYTAQHTHTHTNTHACMHTHKHRYTHVNVHRYTLKHIYT